MTSLRALLATAAVATLAASAASAQAVVVNAQSDIFLAGLSTVPTDFPYNPGAPGLGAGILPPSVAVTPGETLDITASGLASCCLGGSPTNGPNGGGLGGTASIAGYGNVGGYTGVEFPLVGVFGGPSISTPWTIFVIGSSDKVVVPVGATELYLGLPDSLGFGQQPGYYNDNTGAFTVDIAVPEPAAWALMLAGFAGLGAALRHRRGLAAA
jgi:hypothetical protein